MGKEFLDYAVQSLQTGFTAKLLDAKKILQLKSSQNRGMKGVDGRGRNICVCGLNDNM